ncbi:hypothetical protein BP5796_12822 [Coleophoma crateriformis]|uniref:Uncharacterized protein n=1 Tax=Coleophoma crateriformis TaxID=565419 RepID=A0A3D8Q6C5_9HELO|nr:hypothetical protein BP5796_12822 [Coleophoma crateriformis]
MSHDNHRIALFSKAITNNQDLRGTTQLQSNLGTQPPLGLSEISDSSAGSPKSSKEGSPEASNTWKDTYSNHYNFQNEGGLSAIGTSPGLHLPYAAVSNWLPDNVSRPTNTTGNLFKSGLGGSELGPGRICDLSLEWQSRDDMSNIVDVNLWNSWDAWADSMQLSNGQRFRNDFAWSTDFTTEIQENRSN